MSSNEMQTILDSIDEVKTGVAQVKTGVLDMQGDIKKLRAGHAKMGTDFEELRGQVDRIEEQLGCACKQNGDGN